MQSISYVSALFSFLYLKKLKFQKYMSVLENFKNIPRSPSHRATGPKCNFVFFKFATKSLEKKKFWGPVAPPQRATGPCRPSQGRPAGGPGQQAPGGPVAPPAGDRGGPVAPPGSGRLYKASPSFPPLIWPQKIEKKSRKKRGVRRSEAAKFCRIPHLWSTGNFRINSLILYNNLI